MKVKLPNSDVVCPKCHIRLEVEGSDLKYEEDDYWTGNFFFRELEIKRVLDQAPALKDNPEFKKYVFDELMNIAPLAKKSDMDCIYGGLDGNMRVYVVCPVCGKEITIVSAEGNVLRVTASGDIEVLDGEEYYHARKTYNFDDCDDEFEVELTFGKKYTALRDKLLDCGYYIDL